MNEGVFTSEGQLKVGDEGEHVVLGFLKSMKTFGDVVMLKDSRYNHLRQYDIDYVCSGSGPVDDSILLRGDISEINAMYTTVELKTDTRMWDTGNMFLEEELVRRRDGLRIRGYMNKCMARLLFYYDSVGGRLYSGLFSGLKHFYDANKGGMRRVTLTSEIVGSTDRCDVTGYLYSIVEACGKGLMREFKSFKKQGR